jgi:hypothetical protein
MVELMRADFARLPGMLQEPVPEPVGDMPEVEEPDPPAASRPTLEAAPAEREAAQLDLF